MFQFPARDTSASLSRQQVHSRFSLVRCASVLSFCSLARLFAFFFPALARPSSLDGEFSAPEEAWTSSAEDLCRHAGNDGEERARDEAERRNGNSTRD